MIWPRVVEVMMGCWLAASPFIFRHPADQKAYWARDLLCALAVVCLALLSLWRPTRRAHFAIVPVGLWLVLAGFLSGADPVPAALQNDLIVGLILLMLAILPSEAPIPLAADG